MRTPSGQLQLQLAHTPLEQLLLTHVRPRTVSLEQTPENAATVDSSVGVIQFVNVTVYVYSCEYNSFYMHAGAGTVVAS